MPDHKNTVGKNQDFTHGGTDDEPLVLSAGHQPLCKDPESRGEAKRNHRRHVVLTLPYRRTGAAPAVLGSSIGARRRRIRSPGWTRGRDGGRTCGLKVAIDVPLGS
jgi:hypothetical protein